MTKKDDEDKDKKLVMPNIINKKKDKHDKDNSDQNDKNSDDDQDEI